MDQEWSNFRAMAKAFSRLGVAADHVLAQDLGHDSRAVSDYHRFKHDTMSQVMIHATVRRSFYGSVLRGAAESVHALSSRRSLTRFALLSARTGLESAAEMLWLYSSSSEDVRFARALDLLLSEEQSREEFLARGSTVYNSPPRDPSYPFRDLAISEGIDIRNSRGSRNGSRVAASGGVPSKSELIDRAISAALPEGHGRILYSALSTISHAATHFSLEENITGGSPEALRTDNFGAIDPTLSRDLLFHTALTVVNCVHFTADHLGQDDAAVVAAMQTIMRLYLP